MKSWLTIRISFRNSPPSQTNMIMTMTTYSYLSKAWYLNGSLKSLDLAGWRMVIPQTNGHFHRFLTHPQTTILPAPRAARSQGSPGKRLDSYPGRSWAPSGAGSGMTSGDGETYGKIWGKMGTYDQHHWKYQHDSTYLKRPCGWNQVTMIHNELSKSTFFLVTFGKQTCTNIEWHGGWIRQRNSKPAMMAMEAPLRSKNLIPPTNWKAHVDPNTLAYSGESENGTNNFEVKT